MSSRDSSRNSASAPDLWSLPFFVGRLALEGTILASISLARVAQISVQSADAAFGKFIELSEAELKRENKRESVKVE